MRGTDRTLRSEELGAGDPDERLSTHSKVPDISSITKQDKGTVAIEEARHANACPPCDQQKEGKVPRDAIDNL